jgi:uncharacterized protein (TIGR02284 family)
MAKNETPVDTMNRLLRGELSAIETYQQALAKLGDDPAATELRQIHADHRTAANEFRQHVHQLGGKPDQGSGAWGTFAKAVEGTAKLFGNKAALKALKEGEEHGIKGYENALAHADKLPAPCRAGLSTLITQGRVHMAVLNRYLVGDPLRES